MTVANTHLPHTVVTAVVTAETAVTFMYSSVSYFKCTGRDKLAKL